MRLAAQQPFYAVANSTGLISVTSFASAFELLTRFETGQRCGSHPALAFDTNTPTLPLQRVPPGSTNGNRSAMSTDDTNSSQHWRERAATMRLLAVKMAGTQAAILNVLAAHYDDWPIKLRARKPRAKASHGQMETDAKALSIWRGFVRPYCVAQYCGHLARHLSGKVGGQVSPARSTRAINEARSLALQVALR